MQKRLTRVVVVVVALAFAGTASASVQAPDGTAVIGDGTTPACVSPAPVHTYPWYHCYTPMQIRGAYGLTGVPETYFIDRQGRIVGHKIGQASKADLTTGINTLLSEAS